MINAYVWHFVIGITLPYTASQSCVNLNQQVAKKPLGVDDIYIFLVKAYQIIGWRISEESDRIRLIPHNSLENIPVLNNTSPLKPHVTRSSPCNVPSRHMHLEMHHPVALPCEGGEVRSQSA